MKKLLALILVLVLGMGCLVACNLGGNKTDNGDEASITDAIAILKGMYDSKTSATKSFTVPAKVSAKGADFTIEWSVDTDKIVLADQENGKLVTIPANNAAEFTFKLIAKITAPNGSSETREWSIKVPVLSATVDVLEENTAYKLYFYQGNLGQKFYALNSMEKDSDGVDKYIETTIDPKTAPDFFVEKSGEGYKFYTMNGETKSYVEAWLTVDPDDGHYNKRLRFTEDATAASVWFFDQAGDTNKENTNAWFTQCDENNEWYVLGTYNKYTTFSISEESRITADNTGTSQFTAAFMPKAEAEALSPDEEKEFEAPAVEGAVKPVVDQKYNLVLNHGKNEKIYYATGAMSGYYYATSETVTDAVNVYIEETTGGWYLKAIIAGETKYLNIVASGTYRNVKYDDTAVSVWTYVDDLQTVKTTVEGDEYVLGTSSTGTFETFSACKIDSDPFPVRFVVSTNEDQAVPEGGETTATEVSITDAIAAEDGTAVIVKGTVVNIKENWSSYNNMSFTIEDADKNQLYIFRCNTQVELGDQVTITGAVGSYNSVKQIAQGSTAVIDVDHSASACSYPTEGLTAVCTVCGVIAEHECVDADSNSKCDACDRTIQVVTEGSLAIFTFGDNGATGHVDGSEIGTSKEYTSGNYTLSLTNASKVYGDAKDETGISALKLGTSKAAGTFTFTVGEDVKYVVINVAGYKANSAIIAINGGDNQTITTTSASGTYTAIVIDTTTTKTITFTTVTGGLRCMIDSIEFRSEAPTAN